MKNKKIRLQMILEIIRNRHVRCQDDLVKALAEKGLNVTQATLSRDLKYLKVTKIAMTMATTSTSYQTAMK